MLATGTVGERRTTERQPSVHRWYALISVVIPLESMKVRPRHVDNHGDAVKRKQACASSGPDPRSGSPVKRTTACVGVDASISKLNHW
jgi:hypothetical protein